PKRKIDFAPNKKPMPDKNPTWMKSTISKRSIIPMSIPASTRERVGLAATSFSDVHLLKKTRNIIGLTNTISTKANKYKRLFADHNIDQSIDNPQTYPITAIKDNRCAV